MKRLAQKHDKAPAEVLVRWVPHGCGGGTQSGLAPELTYSTGSSLAAQPPRLGPPARRPLSCASAPA